MCRWPQRNCQFTHVDFGARAKSKSVVKFVGAKICNDTFTEISLWPRARAHLFGKARLSLSTFVPHHIISAQAWGSCGGYDHSKSTFDRAPRFR
jgi:hypothetical protein